MNEAAVPQRAERKACNCKGMKRTEGLRAYFHQELGLCGPLSPIQSGTLARAPCGPSHVHICKCKKTRPLLVYSPFPFCRFLYPLAPCGPNHPSPVSSPYLERTWARGFSSNKEDLYVSKIVFVFLAHRSLEIISIMGVSRLGLEASRINTATSASPLTGLDSQKDHRQEIRGR